MAPTVEFLHDNDFEDFMGTNSEKIRDNVGLHSAAFFQALRTPRGIISPENYSKMLPKDPVQRNVDFVDLLLTKPFVLMDLKKVETMIELCKSYSRPDLQKLMEDWLVIMKRKSESYSTYESFVEQVKNKYCESLELDVRLLNGLKSEDDDGKRCLTEEQVEQIKEETENKDKNELFFKFLCEEHYGAQLPFLHFVKTLKACTKDDKHPIAMAFETYYELRRDRKELKSQKLIDEVFRVTSEKTGPGIESQALGGLPETVYPKFASEMPNLVAQRPHTSPSAFVNTAYWNAPVTQPTASAPQVPLGSLNPFLVPSSSSQPTRASAWQEMPGQQSCQVPAFPLQGHVQNSQVQPGFSGSPNNAPTASNGDGDPILFIALLRNYRKDLIEKTEIRNNRQLKLLLELHCISTEECTEINLYPEVVMEQRAHVLLDILAKKQPPYLDLLNNLIEAFDDPLDPGTANIFRRIRDEMFPQLNGGPHQIAVANVIEVETIAPSHPQNEPTSVPSVLQPTVPAVPQNPETPTLNPNEARMVEMLCFAAGFWWYLDSAGRLWLSTQKMENNFKPKYSPDQIYGIKKSPDSAPVFGTIDTITFAGPDIPVDTVQKILFSPKWDSFRINTIIFVNVSFSSQQWAQKLSKWNKVLGRIGITEGPSSFNFIRNIQIIFTETNLIGWTKISVLIKPIVRLLSQKRVTSAMEAWSTRNSIDFQVLVNDFKVLRFHSPKNLARSNKHLVVGRCPEVKHDACKVNEVLQSLTNTLSGFSGFDIDTAIKRASLQSASLTYLNLNRCFVDHGKVAESELTNWYSQLFFHSLPSLQTLIVVGCKLQLDLRKLAENEKLQDLVIANDQVHLPDTRSDFDALGTNNLGVSRRIVICGCYVRTEEARQYLGIDDLNDPYWLISNRHAILDGFKSFGIARPLQWRFGGCKPQGFDDVQASKDRNLVLDLLNVDDFMEREFFDVYCKF